MLKYLIVFVLLTFGEIIEGQQCVEDFFFIDDKCFKAINYLTAPWSRAQGLCEDYDASLAIIDDCILLGDLVRYFHVAGLDELTGSGYWIGATDSGVEGKWLWTNGNNVSLGAPFWGKVQIGEEWLEEPSGGVNENCVQLSLSDQFYFHDEDCEHGANLLCQKDPLVKSSKDWNYLKQDEPLDVSSKDTNIEQKTSDQIIEIFDNTFCLEDFNFIDGSCFFFFEAKSWQEAREFCHSFNASELAVIKDCNLFGLLVKFIKENNEDIGEGEYYLIGGSDEGDEGAWYWVDYSPMVLGTPFWASVNGDSEPSRNATLNCAAMSVDDFYYFREVDCDVPAYAICQRDQETPS